MGTENRFNKKPGNQAFSADGVSVETPVNASGHRQELEQNFGLFSICGIAVTTGESWIVLGNSIVRIPLTEAKFTLRDLGASNLQWRPTRGDLWFVRQAFITVVSLSV
jgi:hypothetical protein